MKLGCRIFKIFSCCIFILIAFTNVSYGQSYGLAFSSHEVFQDKRTGLDLSPDKPLCFKGDFDLSFDISFIPNRQTYFGYVVRIIEDDKRNIDLVYNEQLSKNEFNVIVGDKLSKIAFAIDRARLYNQWNNVRIKFDVDNNKIILYSGNNVLTETGLHLKKNSCYKILFGINNYKQFQTTDIPPMKLRDIKISQNGTLNYNWPLNEESGLTAHELVNQNDGGVINPVWVTAMHRNWQAVQRITVNGVASVAFNPEKEEVYIVGSDSLYTYSVNNAKWASNYNGAKIELNQGNQSIYNSFDNTLYNFFPDEQFVAKYDFKSRTWGKKFVARPVTSFWHLNKMFSGVDTSLYLFGGYGHLLYKNKVQQYHLNSGTWNDVETKGSFFTPRYLAALGSTAMGDTAYILGGYGSNSGQQILNPRNMYDMMRFTVKDKTFTKLFDLKDSGQDFAFANSLIIDDKTKTYYGLIFPQHKYNSTLQLISGSLAKPDYELTANAIPYNFHDIHSFADLYYCPASKRFTVVTLLRTENNQTKVSIFTLMGPPYKVNNTLAVIKNSINWYYLSAAIVLLALLTYFGIKRKNQSKAAALKLSNRHATAPAYANTSAESAEAQVIGDVNAANYKTLFKNSILLFGDLQVFDAEGTEITKYFTPLIKELFLVILLYSIRWGRGLSSEKLNEILWYDKDAKSARNNRSVNIAKLKLLLDKMEHCHLSKDTGYWKIDIDYNYIYVDYHNYLNIVKDKKELNIEKIKCLSEIAQRGNFLSNIEYEWLDTFKSEITNEVIDTYIHFAQAGTTNDPEFLTELANFIFYFDPVNEEAMVIKCKALYSLGKHSLAKSTFESFIKEYKSIYGEEFKKDFNSILE